MSKPNNENYIVVKLHGEWENIIDSIVVVYSTWMKGDTVLYQQPPYSNDAIGKIESFLKNKAEPPGTWKEFSFDKLGANATLKGATTCMRAHKEKHLLTSSKKRHSSSGTPGNCTKKTKKQQAEANEEIMKNAAMSNIDKELEELEKIPCSFQDTIPSDVESDHSDSSSEIEQSVALGSGTHILNTIDKSIKLGLQESNIVTKQDLNEFKDNIVNLLKDMNNQLNTLREKESSHHRSTKTSVNEVLGLVNEMKTLVQETRPLRADENIISLKTLIEKHNLVLPFEDKEQFLDFDSKLKDDSNLFSDLKTCWISTISSTSEMQQIISNILKNFFKRNAIKCCVAQKPTNDKIVMKNTKFYHCLNDALLNIFKNNLDSKVVLSTIGDVINSATDWDGHRKIRYGLLNPDTLPK